jgi:N6-L-threonylcarbamoyladenine synthase
MTNPYDFSFSGLKTAVLRAAQEMSGHDYTFPSSGLPGALSEAQKADIAASFQDTAVKTLLDKLEAAAQQFNPKSIVIAGGVAANQELRKQAQARFSTTVIYPDIKLCTDNAAMIATLAFYQRQPADPYSLDPNPSLSM